MADNNISDKIKSAVSKTKGEIKDLFNKNNRANPLWIALLFCWNMSIFPEK